MINIFALTRAQGAWVLAGGCASSAVVYAGKVMRWVSEVKQAPHMPRAAAYPQGVTVTPRAAALKQASVRHVGIKKRAEAR